MNNEDEAIFLESSKVKEGVVCDVYKYKNDDSKDLGIVTVLKGHQTPRQKILKGLKTLEIFKSGKGELSVIRESGASRVYTFPGDVFEVELHTGDVMQWSAYEDLVFHEVCYPPYEEGRFINLE